MARPARSAGLIAVVLAAAAVLAACDPGFSYWVRNDTDSELTVSFEGQWFAVPAGGAGRGPSSLGVFEGPIEVADAACSSLAVLDASTQEGMVVIDGSGMRLEDLSGSSASDFDALPQAGLAETDRCYGLVRPVTSGGPSFAPAGQSILLIGGPNKDVSRIETDGSGLTVVAATPVWEQLLSTDQAGRSVVVDTVGEAGIGAIVRSDDDGPLEPVVPDGWGSDLSPDGSSIAFMRGTDAYEHGRLFVLDLAGTERQVAPDAMAVRWSPDGAWLAYEVWVGPTFGQNDLWVVHPDGTGARRLTGPGERGRYVVWAPDSRGLAWTRYGDEEASVPSILLFDLADPTGTAGRVLPGTPVGGWLADDWSPDGKSLLVDLYGAGGQGDEARVAGVDLASGEITPLSDPPEFGADGQARWSDDGRSILFLRGGDGEYFELWVMAADGASEHLVASGVSEATWGPPASP